LITTEIILIVINLKKFLFFDIIITISMVLNMKEKTTPVVNKIDL